MPRIIDNDPNDQARVKGTKKFVPIHWLCDCGTPNPSRWQKVMVIAGLGGIGLAALWAQKPIFLIFFALFYPFLAAWWWKFSSKRAAEYLQSRDSFEELPYEIPPIPPDGPAEHLVTIVKCSTFMEADRIVRLLDAVNIPAVIPDKWYQATQSMGDLRNCYPHIKVRIDRKFYPLARQAIMGVV